MASMTLPDPYSADQAFLAALLARDTEAAGEILHDGYALVLVHPVPARMEKVQWLRTLPDYVVDSFVDRSSAWDVTDDVAVHLHLVEMVATVYGADRSGLFVISDTWLRTPAGWQVWKRHSTPFTAGEVPRDPGA